MQGTKEINMEIEILTTGGTFEKEYDELNSKLVFNDTHLSDMLKIGRSKVKISIKKLMMLDSLDITDQNRKNIVKACKGSKKKSVIVIHGTDTIVKTAQAIAKAKIAKTIVLTGSIIPFAFGNSDGMFNLGNALAFAQTLPHGVFIAMNGKCFSPNEVVKNRATGMFENLNK